jgi:hypothetical protein
MNVDPLRPINVVNYAVGEDLGFGVPVPYDFICEDYRARAVASHKPRRTAHRPPFAMLL